VSNAHTSRNALSHSLSFSPDALLLPLLLWRCAATDAAALLLPLCSYCVVVAVVVVVVVVVARVVVEHPVVTQRMRHGFQLRCHHVRAFSSQWRAAIRRISDFSHLEPISFRRLVRTFATWFIIIVQLFFRDCGGAVGRFFCEETANKKAFFFSSVCTSNNVKL
jgi:hypothetical protein